MGDGRISMEREIAEGAAPSFDVLALDAFSGDAIPTHLLTREAFEVYMQLMRPDGIIAINVTNLHIDISPVVRGVAEEFGKSAILIYNDSDPESGAYYAEWILVTSNEEFLNSKVVMDAVYAWSDSDAEPFVWTDDYSNLIQVLKGGDSAE